MNKAAIKKYAPAARKAFIAAVTRRAELLGLDPGAPPSIEHDGDVMLINGQAFSAEIESQRDALEQRIAREGFDVVMDAMAYTWFNRLVAIRYMELHGYLGHGYRVLSHPDDSDSQHNQPEILDHLTDVEMPGLDKAHALDLKLAGNRDEELYREVLLAQCHALHTAMPFLFEPIDDATELLLPDGLLRTDSLVRQLVTAIDEESWQQVEIIGWLYQFYISEKKDQVIGKVVKSEDIPAATQLFTPNWIVKYLVQNSLGRLWLMANPNSQLASKWEYYIQPAEQTPEVNAQLNELIQARIAEDGSTLNPESLTLLDPACGSGHILVEAYDLLRDIYLERGYRKNDIPRLILEKNLFGLDIDRRAAQLAGFALLMRGRADDRKLLQNSTRINVRTLHSITPAATADIHDALNHPDIGFAELRELSETFDFAETAGSLIKIPPTVRSFLPGLRRKLEQTKQHGDLFAQQSAHDALQLLTQAEILSAQYDAVATNPPYMGSRQMNPQLKGFVGMHYPQSKPDLYGCFQLQSGCLCKPSGHFALITRQGWMTGSRFTELRKEINRRHSLTNLLHLGAEAFPEISGEVVQASAYTYQSQDIPNAVANFFDLQDISGNNKSPHFIAGRGAYRNVSPQLYSQLPGSPIIYAATEALVQAFKKFPALSDVAIPRQGMATGDDEQFVRLWHEVDWQKIRTTCSSCEEAQGCSILTKWCKMSL